MRPSRPWLPLALLLALLPSCANEQEQAHQEIERVWQERYARSGDLESSELLARRQELLGFLENHRSAPHGNPRAADARTELAEIQQRIHEERAAELLARRDDEARLRAQLEPLLGPALGHLHGAEHAVDPFPEEPLVLSLAGVDQRSRMRWTFWPSVASYDGTPMEEVRVLSAILGGPLYSARTGLDTGLLIGLLSRLRVRPDDVVFGDRIARDVWPLFAADLRQQYRVALGIRRMHGSGVLAADMEVDGDRVPADVSYDDYFHDLAQAPPNALCLRLELGMQCDYGHTAAFWARRAYDGTLDAALAAMERILTDMGDGAFVEASARLVAGFDPEPRRHPDDVGEDFGPWPGLTLPTEALVEDVHDAVPDELRDRAGERVHLTEPRYLPGSGWTFLATTEGREPVRVDASALIFGRRTALKPATPFAQDSLLTVPSRPTAMTFSPDGAHLALLDNRGNRVRVLDTATGDTVFVKSLEGRWNHGTDLVWTGDGSSIHILHNTSYRDVPAEILRLDVEARSLEVVHTLESTFHSSLALVGDWLVVAHQKSWPSKTVLAYDLGAMSEDPPGPREVTFEQVMAPWSLHPTRPVVALPMGDEQVVVVDLPSGEETQTGHRGAATYSGDGRWLVIGDQVFEVDEDGVPRLDSRRALSVPEDSERLAIGSNGGRFLHADYDRVRVLDLDSNRTVRAVAGSAPMALSSDGRTLVTTAQTDLQIWRLD